MTALAHSMGTDMVPADWAALTVATVAPVLAGYPGLGAVQAVAWHSQRPFAASALVRCDAGCVFVKRHDPRVRGVSDLAEEHAFIAHLRLGGAAVPRVLCLEDGSSAMAAPDGTYEVHAVGEGQDAYRDAPSWAPARSVADARAIGQALAQLHRAAGGFAAPARGTRLLVGGDAVLRASDPVAAIEEWVAGDARLRAALAGRAWRADLRRVLLPWYEAAADSAGTWPALWAHGDLHASNLLWQAGRVSAVLDFGLCNRASAAWDLATAIERNAIAWLELSPVHTGIGRPDLAGALLDGYAEVSPLPAALRHVLPVVHVEFALSELAYFHAITRSAEDAEAAYADFLLGHAAWFATQDGQRFAELLPG